MKPLLFYSLFLLGATLFTLGYGEIPWHMTWEGALLRLQGQSMQWNALLDERLPRLLVLICTGASLAVGGAVMQALFHNPLASPSLLGISTGGCLAVVLTFIFNLHSSHAYALPLAAFMGCLSALLLVYGLARLQQGSPLSNLILTGIAISTLLLAVQGMVLYYLRDHWQLVQLITEWEAGSTHDRHWQHVHMQLPLTLVGLIGCWTYRQELNLLALGEEEARNMGVEVDQIRWHLFLCVSLLTAGVLAAVGMIAFFGLILPHLMRRLHGTDHCSLIPLCTFGGAFALLALDGALRFAGWYAVSLGNVSAILGGCFFLFLLVHPTMQKGKT